MLGGCAEPLPPTPTDYRCFGGFGSVVWVFVGWGVGLLGWLLREGCVWWFVFLGWCVLWLCFWGVWVFLTNGFVGVVDEWFCVVAQVEASDTRTLLDGVGEWVSRGSPPVGELPVVARCWSRGFV